jgi:hypothetical protein
MAVLTRSPLRTLIAEGETVATDVIEKLVQLVRQHLGGRKASVVELSSLNMRTAHAPMVVRTTPAQTDAILRAAAAAEAAASRAKPSL